jgi:hypothetical protein
MGTRYCDKDRSGNPHPSGKGEGRKSMRYAVFFLAPHGGERTEVRGFLDDNAAMGQFVVDHEQKPS